MARAVDVSTVHQDSIKAVFYGGNRTGKTTLLASFPKPMLVISFEPTRTGGMESIVHTPGVRVLRRGIEFTTFTEAVNLSLELVNGNGCGYATVGVDSATSYQDFALESIMGRQLPEQMEYGLVSQDQYRDRASRAKAGLAAFLSLPCNVVVTAKEKDHNPAREEKINPKTGKLMPDMRPKFVRKMGTESLYGPDLGGATAGWLNDACGLVGRLYWAPEVRVEETVSEVAGERIVSRVESETGEYVLCLRTKQHPNYMGGIRAGDHSQVPTCVDNPTYTKILSVLRASA